MIQRLCPELDTGAIGTRTLAGEGTHFNIVSGVGLKSVQNDRGFRCRDEEFRGTARAVDVLVLQRVLDYFAVSLGEQDRLPANLNGGGGGALCCNALGVAAWDILVCGDLFHRLFAKTNLVARREAECVRGPLVDLFGSVVVFPLGELDNSKRVRVFAAKSKAVALQGAVRYRRGVPLKQSRAHVGGTDH